MTTPDNSIRPDGDASPNLSAPRSGDTWQPLPGEPGIPDVARRPGMAVSKKAVAVILVITTVLVFSVFSLLRLRDSGPTADESRGKRPGQRPAAAATEAKRLELPALPSAATKNPPPGVIIPALELTEDERGAPIPLRGHASATQKPMLPEDAPVLLFSSRASTGMNGRPDSSDSTAPPSSASRAALRNLQDYQRQAQGMLDSLLKRSEGTPGAGALTNGAAAVPAAPHASTAGSGLFGGETTGTATPRALAGQLHSRSLTLPKGTTFTCALKTRIVSATSGFVGCQVQRNVYSDDGRVLLVERGSHLDGEYRATSVKPGSIRIPVLWTRLRTPGGVTVELDSPGTGPLGESGVDGHVDNRWGERIGAALLLSLIDDAVKVMVSSQASQGETVVFSSTTSAGGDLAEKVLDSTIHIPPLIHQHQGAIVGIYVARDVDFSSVYELQPSEVER